VLVSCDGELAELLRDILTETYEVAALPHPATIGDIDAADPDVVLVGLSDGGLRPDELVALAARHMRLHAVPFVLMAPDPDLLEHAGRLSQFPGASVLGLPFDLDTIQSVVHSVVPAGQDFRRAARPGRA
jgi:hypothetical protein